MNPQMCRHTYGYTTKRGTDTTYPRGIYRCLVSDYELWLWKVSMCQNPSVVNAFLYVLLSRPFGVKTRTSRKSVTKLRKQIGITDMHRHKSTMNNRKCVLFCFKRLMSECRTMSDRLARKLKMRSKQRCNLKIEYWQFVSPAFFMRLRKFGTHLAYMKA